MSVYYNEFDSFAAAWLRELMKDGLIPEGEVDERSILDVRADELRGYRQCHFFAGIGGWPYALELAGWGDEPVWTGSCPCQPLSSAGQRKGHADERHLWPAFFDLIAECRPAVVFGEQVASKDGREWFAGVRADLESVGYACGGADLPAASVGAPHIRARLWWVASQGLDNPTGPRRESTGQGAEGEARDETRLRGPEPRCADGGVAHAQSERPSVGAQIEQGRQARKHGGVIRGATIGLGPNGRLADSDEQGIGRRGVQRPDESPEAGNGTARERPAGLRQAGRLAHSGRGRPEMEIQQSGNGNETTGQRETNEHGSNSAPGRLGNANEPGPQGHGHVGECAGQLSPWSTGEFIPCADGKARRAEPGIFPLAHGVSNRVGTLRGAGNAIVPQVGAEFVMAYKEARKET